MTNLNFRTFKKSTKTMLPMLSMKAICTNSERLTEAEYNDLIIMRSTGLFDKNGKVIFEGDVVRFEGENGIFCNTFTTQIGFEDGAFGYYGGEKKDNFIALCSISYTRETLQEYVEIIGNIYENGELLNK